ncbi:MAG TPA: type II toxin-antitoxin system PemK/MazF family toxin [Pyrinomonadaceae bacterium]|nr:type II toxin-antitoxin system PemK/MazF family toxin [Pyrinomonadaceae bacterium]
MIQGDVFWYTFKEPDKRRPVLILIKNELIPELNKITVAQITTTMRDAPTQVWLDESDGMLEECAVNLTNIYTVPKEKLRSFITHLSDERMDEVFEAIKFAFGFEK